jgi:hypothetical protein
MTLQKIAICAAALVAATIASQLAQAGGKGGASNFAPGRQSFSSTTPQTEPGKSQFAPGDVKKETGASNARELAPGDHINKSKK